MRIVSASDTYKQFRKEKISDDDLKDAVSRAERGLIDAQLGAFLIKQRIPRKGQGRSKGFRSIICYKRGDRAIFLHMFPKNKTDNLTPVELEVYEKIARNLSNLSDETITQLVQSRGWKEIK